MKENEFSLTVSLNQVELAKGIFPNTYLENFLQITVHQVASNKWNFFFTENNASKPLKKEQLISHIDRYMSGKGCTAYKISELEYSKADVLLLLNDLTRFIKSNQEETDNYYTNRHGKKFFFIEGWLRDNWTNMDDL